jgi:uncharacterized protein
MQLDRYDSVEDFLARAGAYLGAREAEHNLLFGICTGLQRTPEVYEGPNYLATVDADGAVVAAVLRTPPHNMVLSMVDRPEAVDLIADDALAAYGNLPGVLGPQQPARRFAERFGAHIGRGYRLALAERIFRLQRVVPPQPAGGRMRIAEAADRDLLIGWLVDFVHEALGPDEDTSEAAAFADRWIARQYRTMYLWADAGRVVSMVGAGGETPSGIRIGPVYTPPEWRGRGYASNLTAAVSQAQLDAGRRFCFLFTDLANPTSNKIYQAIGYEPVLDVDQYRFDPAPDPASR